MTLNNKSFEENFNHSRQAAKITLDKVGSFDELNASTEEGGNEKYAEKTQELWKEFAVSGVMSFDKNKGEQTLKSYTDLDGNTALGLLKLAGIDISRLIYVKPGEFKEGAINLDTGDKFGVTYDENSQTAYFDHHEKGAKEATSTAEVVYKTLTDLKLLERSEKLDRIVDFVTKIDNRQFPPEEFLRSAKTILGLQRGLKFEQLLAYFQDHQSPNEELTPEELAKYGLKEMADKQQREIDEAMTTLEKMEKDGKVMDTAYGKVVLNVHNELKVGSSAAYVKYDGIINITPGKSFAVTFKEKDVNETEIKQRLGDKFVGKIIRGKMWIYNESAPLTLTLEDIMNSIK